MSDEGIFPDAKTVSLGNYYLIPNCIESFSETLRIEWVLGLDDLWDSFLPWDPIIMNI